MMWMDFERRMLHQILAAVIPADGGRPGLGDLDLTEFWVEFKSATTPLLAFGLRAATWFITFCPLFYLGKPRLFRHLDRSQKNLILIGALTSKSYLIRQMANTLKIVACFAYFRDASIRNSFANANV